MEDKIITITMNGGHLYLLSFIATLVLVFGSIIIKLARKNYVNQLKNFKEMLQVVEKNLCARLETHKNQISKLFDYIHNLKDKK